MIFVCIAYENVQQHTAGFLGLQMALILVSIQNAGYVWDTDIAYDIGIFGDTVEKKRRGTRIAVVVYIICTVIISIVKVSATANLVLSGEAAPWTMKESFISGAIVGQLVDWIWMVFNAVLPLFISFYRSRHEQPLEITITQDQFYG
ncbi:unnamed protein product [Cylindrotheca closterium]|uniref:Uncharacterized protein n=1 Tax=Cylindrotheca closterium TaxID=2856 RepID=A0AAD2G6G9_9STRA|nr:unnamed protein product [Cylindrotheca closterium]